MSDVLETSFALFGFMFPLQLIQLLFAWKVQRKKFFARRVIIAELLYLLCAVGIILGIQSQVLSTRHIGMYLIVFACSFAVIKICCDVSNIETVFITTCGYALQHIAYSIYSILGYCTGIDEQGTVTETLVNLFVQLLVSALAYILIIRKNEFIGERRERDPIMIALAVVVLFCNVCLSVWCSVKGDDPNETVQFFSSIICKLYAIVSCALVIGMEYAVSRMNMINKQKEFMKQLVHMQGSQFQMSQESVSIINRKCHDIKYQIKGLGMVESSEKRKEYIEDLSNAISIYDSVYHTGNETLNLLLREKTLICEEHHIQFSCMADGESLLFIEADDLYVLLGNALDNAIESVMKEVEIEKRVISMNIGTKQGMQSIHIENYFGGQVEFENGLPLTTKKDKNHHGFGVQSIQFLAEKYNGNLVMQKIEDTFYLDLFFTGN